MKWFLIIIGHFVFWQVLRIRSGQYGGVSNPDRGKSYTMRGDRMVETDAAHRAWTSGDLKQMLRATKTKTNEIDRHFLLQSIVSECYRHRKQPEARSLCIEYAEKHLEEFPEIAPVLKGEFDGQLPRVSTFQHYAAVLTEDGRFRDAIAVCEAAMGYGLDDGTQSGFRGRIKRIQKKMAS